MNSSGNLYQRIAESIWAGLPAVVMTVVESKGHSPGKIGTKLLLEADGTLAGTIGGGALEKLCIDHAKELLNSHRSHTESYWLDESATPMEKQKTNMICGGEVTIFFECIPAPTRIILFGAGHIGRALAEHLAPFQFQITLFDDRPELLESFPVEVFSKQSINVESPQELTFDGAYVIIATHSHDLDYQVLETILRQPADNHPFYLGVVASRKKATLFKDRLTNTLKLEELPKQLYMPCGLTIGNNRPHEIAISIISEILALRKGAGLPTHMRDR